MEEQHGDDATEREEALQRLRKRRGFESHLVVYVVVNGAAWVLWALTGGGYPWPAWLTAAWGVGLLLNAWDAYLLRPITDADVERELGRHHPER